jgi:hypothetical protein
MVIGTEAQRFAELNEELKQVDEYSDELEAEHGVGSEAKNSCGPGRPSIQSDIYALAITIWEVCSFLSALQKHQRSGMPSFLRSKRRSRASNRTRP